MKIKEALQQAKPGQLNFIVAGTGRGKTYSVCNFEEWKEKRILFLVSRTAIKEQMVEKYKVNSAQKFQDSHITVSTYHAKEFYQHICQKWDIVVCDEIHCLPMDTIFSKNFSFIAEWIADEVKKGETTVVAMSATPETAIMVFKDYRKVQIELFELGATANVPDQITISFGSEATVDDIINASIIREGKTLIFGKSNSKNYKRSIEVPNGMALCSDTAESIRIDNGPLKVQEITGEHKQKLLQTERFPEGVSTLFTTSTLREGMNIHKEEDLRIIITEFDDLDAIIQAVGRYRHKVKNVYIVLPSVEKMVRDIRASLAEFDDQKQYLDYYLKLREEGDVDRASSVAKELCGKKWVDTAAIVGKNMFGGLEVNRFRAQMKFEHRIHLFRMLSIYSKGPEEIKKYLTKYLGKLPVQKNLREVREEIGSIQLLTIAESLVDKEMTNKELRAMLNEPKLIISGTTRPLSFKERVNFLSERGFIVEDLGQRRVGGGRERYSVIRNKQ